MLGSGIDAVELLFPLASLRRSAADAATSAFGGRYPQIVYLSESPNALPSVYATDHAYLLTGPIDRRGVDHALEAVFFRSHRAGSLPLAVMSEREPVAVLPSEIRFIESSLRIACIHLEDRSIETYATLGDLLPQLPLSFVQCHKSFIVNLRFAERLEGRSLHLIDGTSIPVSRTRYRTTHNAFVRLRERS